MKKFLLPFTLGISLFSPLLSADEIEQKLIQDAVKDYHFAVKNGDSMDICVAAESVEDWYRMAREAENFKKWKKIAKEACEKTQDDEDVF